MHHMSTEPTIRIRARCGQDGKAERFKERLFALQHILTIVDAKEHKSLTHAIHREGHTSQILALRSRGICSLLHILYQDIKNSESFLTEREQVEDSGLGAGKDEPGGEDYAG
jgi:hypothetical protein